MDFHKLYQRFQETKMYKDRWLALYKNLYYYVIPDRDAFNVKWNYRDDGKPVTVQIWDNTAMLAAYQRANDLHALLLPKDRVWGKMILDPNMFSPEAIVAGKPIMDEVNERILFYLNQSNLARIVSSSNLDLVGGTGAIWVESIDDETPLYFRSIPAVALYIEYSTDDVLNTCWYQCKMTGRQVMQYFPDYRGMGYLTLSAQPDVMYIVMYGQIKMAENNFYLYGVLNIDPFTPLWETERNYNQVIIYRDRVRPGESDGRGIGIDLLPTIQDLNRIVAYDRQNQAFKANPPMFYDNDAYFNPYSVRQWAGAMIARKPGGRNPLEALQMPSYVDTLKHIQDLRDVIRTGFQIDPLGEINTPVKSATEVSIRENRAQRTSATDISRLINELPKQIFEVAAKILAQRRLITKKGEIGEINTKKMRFDFQSPLFDLQKQDDLNHFITNLQIKQQFFGQGAAMATVNLAKANEFLTDKLNLPADLFVSEEQLQQYVEGASEMAQQGALPQPSTTAGKVNFPAQSQVQF
jgi:hypothetical protein